MLDPAASPSHIIYLPIVFLMSPETLQLIGKQIRPFLPFCGEYELATSRTCRREKRNNYKVATATSGAVIQPRPRESSLHSRFYCTITQIPSRLTLMYAWRHNEDLIRHNVGWGRSKGEDGPAGLMADEALLWGRVKILMAGIPPLHHIRMKRSLEEQ